MALPLLREFDLSTRSMVLWPLTRFNGRDLLRYSGLRRFQFSTFTLSQNAFSLESTDSCHMSSSNQWSSFTSGLGLREFGTLSLMTLALLPSTLRLFDSSVPSTLRPFMTSSFDTSALRQLWPFATSAFGTSELLSFVGGETPEVNLPE
jgi:hypothetical protein